MDKKKFGTGAVFPPGKEWQMGKTVASIDFVREADDAIAWLLSKVKAVKKGEIILYDEVGVKQPQVYGWVEALVKPNPIRLAIDSFAMNYVNGGNIWGCGIGSGKVIHVYVVDASKENLPNEYEGFKVVVVETGQPVP